MRVHLMLSDQFQEDKQSDTVGIILHTIVTNMITKRNYINIQGTPIRTEKKMLLYQNFSFRKENTFLTVYT